MNLSYRLKLMNIWISFWKKNFLIKYTKKSSELYAGKIVMNNQRTNEWIKQKIEKGEPFVVSRFGKTELGCITQYYKKKLFGIARRKRIYHYLCNLSGFFPESFELIDDFCQMILMNIKEIDLLGIWKVPMENFFINRYMINAEITNLREIEPYYSTHPWSEALKGKKVLVVHPFSETIKSQYMKREHLFEDKRILPEFTLITYQAVQTIAEEADDRFDSWFDALNHMADQIEKVDFDIALVGCGAYGMPLAIRIKQMGKQAIHMGGALQILFGIKGKRWDTHPQISKMYNVYWVRPSQEESPKGKEGVENACYW